MDSEARHPDVLVVYATHKLVGCCWNGADTGDETTRRAHAVDLQVGNVKAHIEIFGDVPLGTCANPPALPIVVAAHICHGKVADAGARTLQ